MLLFQRISCRTAVLLLLLSLTPQTPAAALPASSQDVKGNLQPHQAAAIVGDIIAAAGLVTQVIQEGLNFLIIDDNKHAIEPNYAQAMSSQLLREHPNKNVAMFHNQDCQFSSVNWIHQHVECDIGHKRGQGYEVYVFDTRSFDLVSDGGFINWCVGGNLTRNGNHVNLYPREVPTAPIAPPPTTPPLPPPSPTRANIADTDGSYFVDCHNSQGVESSGMAYYKALIPEENVEQQR